MTVSSQPHLVLFCVDALRADCLGAYSFDESIWAAIGRPETKAFDALAESSRVFGTAVAASSWTKPSVPSLLQSLHPSEHGVFEVAKDRHRMVLTASLPDEVPTLAESLKAGGYHTIGLGHNAQLDTSLGFARGFDTYAASAGSADSILARLEELDPFARDRPVFLYLHPIEPHWPFGADIVKRARDHAVGRFPFHTFKASEWKALKRELKKGELELTETEVRFLRLVYRIAVEAADRMLERLLAWLDDSGALEQSVFVATADHGEELLDHGVIGHGQSLHEELVRVPLLIRTGAESGVAPRAERIDRPVGHVDVGPTLLEAAGIEPHATASGRSLFSEAPNEDEPAAFSEVKHKRRYHQSVHTGRYKLIRSYRFRKATVQDGEAPSEDYNNLEELFADRPFTVQRALYDLANDPCETHDLGTALPDVADRLEARLDRWWGGLEHLQGGVKQIEEAMIRRLEALGYL